MTTPTLIAILWTAVCAVESTNNPLAYNASADAVGIAQITPIALRCAQRHAPEMMFTSDDRWSPARSEHIFATVLTAHLPKPRVVRARDGSISVVGPTLRDGALVWRCGADRTGKDGPRYWKKIEKEMKK